jgi:hypothetical protein
VLIAAKSEVSNASTCAVPNETACDVVKARACDVVIAAIWLVCRAETLFVLSDAKSCVSKLAIWAVVSAIACADVKARACAVVNATISAVVSEAMDVIGSGKPRLLEFGVADEVAWQVGLSCGGKIAVYVEKVVS